MTFYRIEESDLKKADKMALATLYYYWLEQSKEDNFNLPLFINDKGKGLLSADSFSRVFFSFREKCKKLGFNFHAEPLCKSSGVDSYCVIHIEKSNKVNTFSEPPKSALKRESSQITKARSEEKKQLQKTTEKEFVDNWNRQATEKIIKHLLGKYSLKLNAEQITELQIELITILKSI